MHSLYSELKTFTARRRAAPGRSLIAAALFAAMLPLVGAGIVLHAETFNQDGLKIEVVRVTTDATSEAAADKQPQVPGYTVFRVTAENPTAEDRTLHAVIALVWKDPKDPQNGPKSESACVAYLEIPAGHRLTETVPCKGQNFTAYEFQIKSVLPFVLDRSPLKWQKAEALK